MVRGHEPEVAGRPHVDEGVRPDAGHPVLGHLGHLEVREPRQLAVQDRIQRRVLRRLAAEGVQKRDRLVQLVHDRRVPPQVPAQQPPHRDLRVVDVAVVVVEDILPPVRRSWCALALVGHVDAVAVVPVDVAVAPVGFGRGRDRHDDVAANLLDEWRFLDRKPVGKLHEHLGRPRFRAVQPSHQVVDRPGAADDLARLLRREAARVGEPREVNTVLVEVLDSLLRAHEDHDALPAFVGMTDVQDPHARRFRLERAVIAEASAVVRELLRGSDVIA